MVLTTNLVIYCILYIFLVDFIEINMQQKVVASKRLFQ